MEITRNIITTETITIPEGMVVCTHCDGLGLISKYDQGFKSFVYSAAMAAKRECIYCKGQGYADKRVA